jgi:hypothetical protein
LLRGVLVILLCVHPLLMSNSLLLHLLSVYHGPWCVVLLEIVSALEERGVHRDLEMALKGFTQYPPLR